MLFTILDSLGLTFTDLIIATVVVGVTLGAAIATVALSLTTASTRPMPAITAFRTTKVAR